MTPREFIEDRLDMGFAVIMLDDLAEHDQYRAAAYELQSEGLCQVRDRTVYPQGHTIAVR